MDVRDLFAPLNVTWPSGEQGPQGEQGPTGETGPTGDPGTPGANANVSNCWPIGSVFLSVVSTNPATLLGFASTWTQIAGSRALIGQGLAPFDTAGNTGGASTVTLTSNELPAHTHSQGTFAPRIINSGTAGTVGVQGASAASNANASNAATQPAAIQSTGGGAAFSVLNPYFVIYVWKRTA